MRNETKRITAIVGACIIMAVCLFGCSNQRESFESIEEPFDSPDTTELAVESPGGLKDTGSSKKTEMTNMVDERFELLSLVFRLAGKAEYGDADTEYQQGLASRFEDFAEHEAVGYAAKLPLGYDAVFKFSVHIVKDGDNFVFIDDTYSEIDLEWFRTYVDPKNLHSIYSPSSTRNNYSATVNNTMVYSSVSAGGSAIVHEYCHSFANPIAHRWYEENEGFRQWCDDTMNLEKMPFYSTGEIIAGEYVTRAYNALYYAEHGYEPISLLLNEKLQGFPYIENVFAMITEYKKADMRDIASILGVQYEMGGEQSVSIGDRLIRWKVLTLSEPLSFIYVQTEVGNVFDSHTGDVLYVEDTGEANPYLMIDLGETTFQGKEGFRSYCRIPMER